jgi:colanic acid biosynthesis glycosyl transferase WcaI
LHIQDFEVDAAFDMGILRSNWFRRFVLSIERWIMRRFDKISTISHRMLHQLLDKGVCVEKQIYFPNWVDTKLIYPLNVKSPFRKELGFTNDDIILLYSGNMGLKQGLEIVIESARKLKSDKHVYFVMCGNGMAYELLREMARDLSNIVWLPLQPLSRLNDLLNLADIHLLPQRSDAADLVMPSKLTGMLASGRPVIATASEGTEVWSVVEGCGVNVSPGDIDGMTAAIKSLASDVGVRIRLGQNGRKYAEKNLSANVVLENFENELLGLVSTP